MDKIKEIVDALNEQEPSWKENFDDMYLPSVYLYSGSFPDEGRKLMSRLLLEVLNKQKQLNDAHDETGEEQLWREIYSITESDSVVKIIKDINGGIMEMYRNTRPLREAQESVIPLIIAVFEHVSSNYAPDFFETGEEYGINVTADFVTAVLQLDRIISVHVGRHYDKRTAQQEFMKGTGLGDQYGLVYAELYEKYLDRIQHNICIDKLDELNARVNRLTQEVHDMMQELQRG